MMRLTLIAGGALLLSACAATEAPTPDAGMIDDSPDQCRASQYQNLIGRPRADIPQTPAGATWRVTCASCPVTMDYNPSRLNIFYNQDTEIVEQVRCG